MIFNDFSFLIEPLNLLLPNMIIKDDFVALRSKGIVQNPLQIAELWRKWIRLERGEGVSLHFLLHLLAEIPGTAQMQCEHDLQP